VEPCVLNAVLQWIGFGLCHQLPERSFFGGGVQVPVCARDTGIYVGFIASILILALLQRTRPTRLPGLGVSILLAAMLFSMVLDGVLSYAGLRETTNAVRLLTGLAAGYSMAAVATPLINDELWRRASSERVLSRTTTVFAWLGSMLLIFALLFWLAPLLGVVYPVFVTVCILATLTAVNLLIVLLLPAFGRKAERFRDARIALALAFALSLFEIAVAALLKYLLVMLVGG
jgi:uncharacterized membrane protein